MGRTIAYFDIETKNLFTDIYPTWNSISWREKKSIKHQITAQLKMGLAGVLVDDESVEFFYEDDLLPLFNALKSVDIIVGHNLLGFDYIVLEEYYTVKEINFFKSKTFDTFDFIRKKFDVWTSLDDLGKLNFNSEKLEDTLEIPKLLRNGDVDRVKEYLVQDLKITKQLYELGNNKGLLKYTHKEYGKTVGVRELPIEW